MAAQHSNVFFPSCRGDVSQISVAGIPGFRTARKSTPLLCKAAANKLRVAGTSFGSRKCISIRLRGVEPSVPSTKTLLIVAVELGPNTPLATSLAEGYFLPTMSALRRVGAIEAATCPWTSAGALNRPSQPSDFSESYALAGQSNSE